MRIAFDVKGTLDGPKGHIILNLLLYLQERGHEVVVWSNMLSFASQFVKDNGLKCEFMSKQSLSDMDMFKTEPFDWAIEDDEVQCEYLGAKQFLLVHKIETLGWCLKKMGIEHTPKSKTEEKKS